MHLFGERPTCTVYAVYCMIATLAHHCIRTVCMLSWLPHATYLYTVAEHFSADAVTALQQLPGLQATVEVCQIELVPFEAAVLALNVNDPQQARNVV
jgi:hypothetical protein